MSAEPVSTPFLATQLNDSPPACSISTNGDLGEPQPLLLKPNWTEWDAFFLPEDTSGTITFGYGDPVNLACPGSTLIVDDWETTLTSGTATCVSGTRFSIFGQTVSFDTITCSSYPWHTARYSGRGCWGGFREIEVGFQVGDGFLKHLEICFDDERQSSVYSRFNLTSAIGGYQHGFPRPTSFIQGGFFK